MAIVRALSSRVRGTVAASLQRRAADELDDQATAVLREAVDLWRADNWHAFDDKEVNCTVQIYRWCRDVVRRDDRFALLTVQLEWINVTPEVLAGLKGVDSATRPDLRIEVGSSGRVIECKRLSEKGPWARRYVYDGLARFVVGDYAHAESSGFMLGYLQEGGLAEVVDRVNDYIAKHTSMGTGHEVIVDQHAPPTLWGHSSHVRAAQPVIEVRHILMDVT